MDFICNCFKIFICFPAKNILYKFQILKNKYKYFTFCNEPSFEYINLNVYKILKMHQALLDEKYFLLLLSTPYRSLLLKL